MTAHPALAPLYSHQNYARIMPGARMTILPARLDPLTMGSSGTVYATGAKYHSSSPGGISAPPGSGRRRDFCTFAVAIHPLVDSDWAVFTRQAKSSLTTDHFCSSTKNVILIPRYPDEWARWNGRSDFCLLAMTTNRLAGWR
jgi:hypothetical protein